MKNSPHQGASSAEQGGSARPAEESGPSQKQEGSAGSRRFTPAQQAVVTALMVVMERAAKDGREAINAAKLTLVSNNLATYRILEKFPDEGPHPSVKQLEQRASDQLLESLTKLASQCAAAKCQPLEVFTRSLQCTIHRAGENSIAAIRRTHERQRRKQPPRTLPGWCSEPANAIQQLKLQQNLAELSISLLHVLKHSADEAAATLTQPYVDHMLPGVVDTLGKLGASLAGDDMITLVSAIKDALQAYQVRAASSGQSFEHMVLLEAAVQGWSLDTPYAGTLMRAMIAAEGCLDIPSAIPHAPAHQIAAPKIAAFEKPGQQNRAVSHLKECSGNVLAILKWVISNMDVSDKDLSPAPRRALTAQERRLKALLTGLLPGITEELYCAVDKSNAEMCGDLVKSAARHVESFIQVWRQEAKEKEISLPQLLDGKVEALGFSPSELSKDVERAISDISANLPAESEMKLDATHATDATSSEKMLEHAMVVMYHYFTTLAVSTMHGMVKAGKEPSSYFWLLKALAQQMALRLLHWEEAHVLHADHFLLTGPSCAIVSPHRLGPEITNERFHVIAWHTTRMVVLQHALAAEARAQVRGLNTSLRAHLEHVAGYTRYGWGAGKPDVAHLIAILADRIGAKEGPPGKAWKKLTHEATEIARVVESAFMIADTVEDTKYAALCSIFPGLPRIVPAKYKTEFGTQLLQDANLVKQQIQVHMHIASVRGLPFSLYMEKLLGKHRIDILQRAGGSLHVAICRAAHSLEVDVDKAKMMHIQMCVKNIMFGGSPADAAAAWGDPHLVLLSRIMDICTTSSVRPKLLEAIGRALPGVLDCLTELHEWPHGFKDDQEWLTQATERICNITAQHTKDAHDQGIQPEEHVRKVLAVPGLEDQEIELLMGVFEELWGDQNRGDYTRRTQSAAETAATMSALIGRCTRASP